jgi:uncharacterized protein
MTAGGRMSSLIPIMPGGVAHARELLGTYFQISETQLEMLEFACTWHTETKHQRDPTIGICWDADRLDLVRVGKIPNPRYMNTSLGKEFATQLRQST